MTDASKVTLRFVTAHDIISDDIRFYQRGFWATHVETLMPEGTLIGAHFNGGVLARQVGYDKDHMAREQYVPVKMASQEHADAYHAFMRLQVGKPYDVEAIAGMILQRDWRDPSKWFCSELVAGGFCECQEFPDHLAVELQHVTPRDVFLIASSRVSV